MSEKKLEEGPIRETPQEQEGGPSREAALPIESAHEKKLKAAVSAIPGPDESEAESINGRLKMLVVAPINAKYPDGIEIDGKVRTGADIARAIPNVEAFLSEVDLQVKDDILLDFFQLNKEGELVMKDDCKEAYGLGENALQARIRQTRIVYEKDGENHVMTGVDYFHVTNRDGKGRPTAMEVSREGGEIDLQSALMVRGLPTLNWDGSRHTGEYARMNTGQLEIDTYSWTDDKTLVNEDGSPNFSRARYAYWDPRFRRVRSSVGGSNVRYDNLGSRGVLRVKLDFKD